MSADPNQKKNLAVAIAGGVVLVVIAIGAIWYIFSSGESGEKVGPALGPSDSMIPTPPTAEAKAAGQIVLNPMQIQFPAGNTPNSGIFTIGAIGAPVGIDDVSIPASESDVFTVSNIDCPSNGQLLQPGSSCKVSVAYSGKRAVQTTALVKYRTSDNTGQMAPSQASLAIGVGGDPAGIPGLAVGPNGAPIPGMNQAVSTMPSQPVPDANAGMPVTASNQGPAPVVMSPAMQARYNYLQNRRNGGGQLVPATNGLTPVARGPYTSWTNVGVTGTSSSFPTDMARVLTPDKPIFAVLSVPIDTRQTVTAVAMVDRDIYGSSGRTVVIPRGSKLIGQIGGTPTERVGIAWSQVIRPDGARFVFEGSSGDAAGRGGIPGRVNERNLQRYGYSLLPSLVSAGITVGLGGQTSQSAGTIGSTQTQDSRAVAAQILNQPLNQIAQDIYRRKGMLPVQITVAAGTRITVWATGDLRLKPVGENDDDKSVQANSGRQPMFGTVQSARGQGFNPYQAQNSGASNQAATAAAPINAGQGNAGGGNGAAGTIDANGNYIPPSASAPSPANSMGFGSGQTGNSSRAPWQN